MNNVIQFVMQTGLVAKAILVILFFISVISWGIIIEKLIMFWKIHKESDRFTRLFKIRVKWHDRYIYSQELKHSPIARIFRSKYIDFIEGAISGNQAYQKLNQPGTNGSAVPSAIIETAITEEMSKLERHLIFLATTVSVSPFLGLLGTVWGIMSAFLNMGLKGTANITAVGPGIAEALITTIAGLAVAIPAVVAYNYFVDKLQRLEKETDSFFVNLLTQTEREKIHEK